MYKRSARIGRAGALSHPVVSSSRSHKRGTWLARCQDVGSARRCPCSGHLPPAPAQDTDGGEPLADGARLRDVVSRCAALGSERARAAYATRNLEQVGRAAHRYLSLPASVLMWMSAGSAPGKGAARLGLTSGAEGRGSQHRCTARRRGSKTQQLSQCQSRAAPCRAGPGAAAALGQCGAAPRRTRAPAGRCRARRCAPAGPGRRPARARLDGTWLAGGARPQPQLQDTHVIAGPRVPRARHAPCAGVGTAPAPRPTPGRRRAQPCSRSARRSRTARRTASGRSACMTRGATCAWTRPRRARSTSCASAPTPTTPSRSTACSTAAAPPWPSACSRCRARKGGW